jgi:hypothetical protein
MGGGGGKARIHGKTNRLNLIHRDSESVKGLGCRRVGYDPEVCWGRGPEAMNRNRICHNRDQPKRGPQIFGKAGDEVSVDGEGKSDDFWAVYFDQFPEAKCGRTICEESVFDQREVVTSQIEKIPGSRIAIDQRQVEAAKEVV